MRFFEDTLSGVGHRLDRWCEWCARGGRGAGVWASWVRGVEGLLERLDRRLSGRGVRADTARLARQVGLAVVVLALTGSGALLYAVAGPTSAPAVSAEEQAALDGLSAMIVAERAAPAGVMGKPRTLRR